MSDFLVDAAHHAATRTIESAQIIRLSLADQERVAALLDAGPSPSPALDRAMAAHSVFFAGNE